jgi:hypothetical protein
MSAHMTSEVLQLSHNGEEIHIQRQRMNQDVYQVLQVIYTG